MSADTPNQVRNQVQSAFDNSGVSAAWDRSVGWAGNKIGGLFDSGSTQMHLNSPTALSATPTLAGASTTALQNQLAQASNARATSTYLTGGAGLLEEPTTTSRVLLGS